MILMQAGTADASEALKALKQHLAKPKPVQEGFEKETASFAVLEDRGLQQTSSSLSLFSQQIQLIDLVRKSISDAQDAQQIGQTAH